MKRLGFLLALLAMTPEVMAQSISVTNEPCGGWPIAVKATGTTAAVMATLALQNSLLTLYICHADVSASATAASTIGPVTITGTAGGTLTFQLPPIAANSAIIQSWNFTPCWPASAAATNISVTTTANSSASAVDVDALGCMK
jgi:hypothetical protein